MISPEELAIFGISAEVIAKALGDLYLDAYSGPLSQDSFRANLRW